MVDELSTHSVCRSCSASWLEVFFVQGNRQGRRRRRLRSTKKTRARGVAMEMVTFTIIVDDIVYPDGHSAMACLGGGGASLCLCLPVFLCLALFLHVLGTSVALHNSFVVMWKAFLLRPFCTETEREAPFLSFVNQSFDCRCCFAGSLVVVGI